MRPPVSLVTGPAFGSPRLVSRPHGEFVDRGIFGRVDRETDDIGDPIGAVETSLRSRHDVLVGQVRIDMLVAFGRDILLPNLLDLCRPHPEMELVLTFSEGLTDPAAEDVDLLVRFSALEDSSHLIAQRLATQNRAAASARATWRPAACR